MLWPAVVALLSILLTRHAVLGLLAGGLSGCLLLADGNLTVAVQSLTVEYFFASMQGPWRIGALIFTLILGAFTVIIEKGGGFDALARRWIGDRKGGAKRRLETITAAMGGLCFFDGLANSLLIGRITRPLADKVGVARAKMAYLVDSTSSSISCIAFISTWIATQLSLIQQSIEGRGIDQSPYGLFFFSIPFNFYCLFTLILVVIVIWRRWDIGAMKHAGRSESQTSLNLEACRESMGGRERSDSAGDAFTPSVWVAFAPIILLSASILLLFYIWDTRPLFPVTAIKLSSAFSGDSGPYALTLGSAIGLLAAAALFPRSKKDELLPAMSQGAASMLSPLLILVMAWTFGGVLADLGTARWIADAMSSSVSVSYFAAATFVTGAVVSFMTGSSWGTMALLMPIAVPAYLDLSANDPEFLPAVIGAVFSGAVFGDHCSPFSDTTIVSAFSCGVSPREHVVTQLPYACLAASVALGVGFIGIGVGLSAAASVLVGTLLLLGLAWLCTRGLKSEV